MTKLPPMNEYTQALAEEIAALIDSFPSQPRENQTALSELLASNPEAFSAAAIRALKNRDGQPGVRYLTNLLAKEDLLLTGLLDSSANPREAVALARSMSQQGISLQLSLEQALIACLHEPGTNANVKRILQILDLLAGISSPTRLRLFQTPLMAYPDKNVQSKAALLIGSSAKCADCISDHVRHPDFRVQANAVEALWSMSRSDSRALLAAACQSPNNRVAANAALGLYRIGEVCAIRALLQMATHTEPLFQLSGLWAIGETQDPRFLPFLTAQFNQSQGRKHLAVTRALSRIRRRETIIEQTGAIQITVSRARVFTDGSRKLSFALRSSHLSDLSGLKPTDFALWEADSLIEEYTVRSSANAMLLAIGFVAPCSAMSDPYAEALTEAFARCLSLKRPVDLWRIDGYCTGHGSLEPKSAEVLTRPGARKECSFLSDPEVLLEMVKTGSPRHKAAMDAFTAVQRQCLAISKHSAKRHMFVFLHQGSNRSLTDAARLKRLTPQIEHGQIALHGFAPAAAHECPEFERLCLGTRGGSFAHPTFDELADAIEQSYAQLTNSFEISYSVPSGSEPRSVLLKILSDYGTGQATFTLEPSP